VLVAKAWNSQRRPDLAPAEDQPAPEGVDYELWLGPASARAFNPNRFHYTWHWTWDFGTGDMGNDGVHDLDVARWGLGVGLPRAVQCTATRAVNRHWETPDTVYATFRFPETESLLIFEQRDWSPYLQEGLENGVAFHGTEGYMLLGRAGWRLFEGNREVETSAASFSDRPHFDDFLEAIRTGRRPNADIEEGHRSAALVHLANIAHRVDRPITFDVATESIVGDVEANRLASKTYRDPFGIGSTT
jgi:predicted dehydrogenase